MYLWQGRASDWRTVDCGVAEEGTLCSGDDNERGAGQDPHRFRKSRDAGCYAGLQPGRRNSGQSQPQMHSRKEGDPYLRTLLVQAAQHILGPFGVDSDLRR